MKKLFIAHIKDCYYVARAYDTRSEGNWIIPVRAESEGDIEEILQKEFLQRFQIRFSHYKIDGKLEKCCEPWELEWNNVAFGELVIEKELE